MFLRSLTSLLTLLSPAAALALPQDTTGPSGGFSPYAENTTISYFTGRATTAGTDIGTVAKIQTGSPLDGCGFRIGQGTIKSLRCTILKHSEIAIGQTNNGSCTFTLFADSTSCSALGTGASYGYNKKVISIPNGDEATCIGTGVVDGGLYTKASGVWACG